MTKAPQTETFSRWDVVDHLRTEADMAAYLKACADEAPGDAVLMDAALRDVARARAAVGKSL